MERTWGPGEPHAVQTWRPEGGPVERGAHRELGGPQDKTETCLASYRNFAMAAAERSG